MGLPLPYPITVVRATSGGRTAVPFIGSGTLGRRQDEGETGLAKQPILSRF
jgi:hypothetical protein